MWEPSDLLRSRIFGLRLRGVHPVGSFERFATAPQSTDSGARTAGPRVRRSSVVAAAHNRGLAANFPHAPA